MMRRKGKRHRVRWSAASMARLCALIVLLFSLAAAAAPVHLVAQRPVSITRLADGTYLLDFGREAFGNLLLQREPAAGSVVTLRFGEALRDGRVDRTPPGSVRYAEVQARLTGHAQVVAPPPNARNTRPPAVLTNPAWGVLIPFRWVEVQGWPGRLHRGDIVRRAAYDSTWNEAAAGFHSSDPMLDRIWALCHNSIEATTFAGIFIDGDRERLAYEADAYLTQLSYYAGDPNPQMARDTLARLMQYPTWPTEWAPQMVFMAYADWMQTADKTWLAQHYAWLKTKTLEDRVGADGLVHSTPAQIHRGDIVDWPADERDGYVFTPVNTVVNAFYLRAIEDMRLLALALGKQDEAEAYAREKQKGLAAFQAALFNPAAGLYRDGTGTDHASLHANLFPLAFGLVPAAYRPHIAAWLAAQGMRGSPYAAQYLLQALFENGQARAALQEMTAPGDRSWAHMVNSGATITWEAWDQKYKPNLDWTHAWGAAPANLLPRFVLGVAVGSPGWSSARIAPRPGGLRSAEGTVPTPRGAIHVAWVASPSFRLRLQLPRGMLAAVQLPATDGSSGVLRDGRPVLCHREGAWWVVEEPVSGKTTFEVQ